MPNKLLYPTLTLAAFLVACGPETAPENNAPTIDLSSTTLQLTALETSEMTFTASDVDKDAIEMSLTQAPAWVQLSNNKLMFSPANPDAGVHSIVLNASDGESDTQTTLTVTVSENSPLPPLTDYRTRSLEDEVMYFVMTDRFYDGDTGNNEGDPSDPLASGGYDKTRDGYYHGGDLQGLKAQLSYIEDLGASAIWLTPILKNKAMQGDSAGYHGYWTLDFTSIDPHLGGDDGLRDFIAAAHERNLKVFFDIIVNHSADVIKYEECHNPDGSLLTGLDTCEYKSLAQLENGDDYTPFIPVGEENAKVPSWLNDTQYYHNQGESTWAGENSLYGDFVGLDDIDTNNPVVADNFTEVFKDIVRDFRPDGFRVDTVKHVNTEFWQTFMPAVLDYAHAEDTDGLGTYGANIPNFTMFGEVYSSDPATLSYFTTEAKIPSVLDFGFQAAITNTINSNGVVATDATHPLTELFEQDDLYSDADSSAATLLNFVGNHDMGRFAYFLGDTLDWEEEALAKVDLAHAAMYFSRGVPVIYYGAEQGFIGTGGDKAARQDMMPSAVASYNSTDVLGTDKTSADNNFDTDHPLYLKWREYARILRDNETLRTGEQHIRSTDTSNIFALSRFNEATLEEYLIVFNFNPDRRKTATIPALADTYSAVYGIDTDITASNGELSIPVPASSLVILKTSGITDMAAPVISAVDAPTDNSYVSGNLAFKVTIDGADARDIPTYTASLELSVDNGSSWQTVATDKNYPYQLYLNTADIADGTSIQTRIQATNLNGDSDTSNTLTLNVDSRNPVVTLDYEGAAIGKRVSVTFASGQSLTLPAESTAIFDWSEASDALVTFFTPGNNGVIDADQPVWITRDTVMAQATTNQVTEQLESTLFINTSGSIAGTDNDTGNPAQSFDQSQAADLGTLNIRGSLNSWGVDAMAYNNGTYFVQLPLTLGDIEFKFADASWASVNIGGPITENGLARNSNPSNLNQNISTAGNYNVYLLLGDIDKNGTANEYIHIIDPE